MELCAVLKRTLLHAYYALITNDIGLFCLWLSMQIFTSLVKFIQVESWSTWIVLTFQNDWSINSTAADTVYVSVYS